MLARINLFVAWFLLVEIFFRNMLTTVGTWLLYKLGMPAPLHEQFGWLAGALMLMSVLLVIRNLLGELPPGVGKRDGKGYKLGHRVLFACSLLAFWVFILPVFVEHIHSEFLQVTVSMFVIDFMYMSLAAFGVGISLIYQSTLPSVAEPKPKPKP